MEYGANLKENFSTTSYCYMCFPKKNLSPLIYEINMMGYEKVGQEFRLKRQGYYTYLLSYTFSGSAKIIYQNREFIVKRGDLLFINCNEMHEFIPLDKTWEFTYIHITGLGISNLYEDFFNAIGNVFHGYPRKDIIPSVNKIKNILNGCPKTQGGTDHTQNIDLEDNVICMNISRRIYDIVTNINNNICNLNLEIPYCLKQGIKFINEHFTEKILLDDVAEYCYISKFHFERLFKKYMNCSAYEYISSLRFERARWLLDTTTINVEEIAVLVGYSDIQALVKLFKKNLNVTPTKYRQQKNHYEINKFSK